MLRGLVAEEKEVGGHLADLGETEAISTHRYLTATVTPGHTPIPTPVQTSSCVLA